MISLLQFYTTDHSKTTEVICSNAKWERENERKQEGRIREKKDVLLEKGHQIYVSLMHADFSDISLFPPPLSVSHTKPPHKISQIKTLSISASPHLTAHKSFYFMKPKWNGYIKGHIMVTVLPYTLNNNRETDHTHTSY